MSLPSVSRGSRAFHGARVTDTSGQSIANATTVTLAFAGAETYDTDGYHDLVTNNSRLTVPPGLGGKYRIGGAVGLVTSSTAGTRHLGIMVNGATWIALTMGAAHNWAGGEQYVAISTEFVLAAGDFVQLKYRQESGGALPITAEAEYGCNFWLSFLGA